MLTLTREQGSCIFIGRHLSVSDPEGTCDYRIDFDVVDHRVGQRRAEVTVISRFDVERHVLTPAQPDLDFAPDCRLAFLNTHEYLEGQACMAAVRVGIRAPRDVRIMRDNMRAVVGRNGGLA